MWLVGMILGISGLHACQASTLENKPVLVPSTSLISCLKIFSFNFKVGVDVLFFFYFICADVVGFEGQRHQTPESWSQGRCELPDSDSDAESSGAQYILPTAELQEQ